MASLLAIDAVVAGGPGGPCRPRSFSSRPRRSAIPVALWPRARASERLHDHALTCVGLLWRAFRLTTPSGGNCPTNERDARLHYARPVTTTRMATGAERTLELLEHQVGRPLAEVETPVAVDRPRPPRGESAPTCSRTSTSTESRSGRTRRRTSRRRSGGASSSSVQPASPSRRPARPRSSRRRARRGSSSTTRRSAPTKWERLADVAASGVELTVAVDSVAPAEGLAARRCDRRGLRAELLVEIDVGLHRTGPDHRRRRARGGAGLSRSSPRVEVAGISCYPGHCRRRRSDAASEAGGCRRVPARDTRCIRGRRLRTDRISGGSTPTRYLTHDDVCQRAPRPARTRSSTATTARRRSSARSGSR